METIDLLERADQLFEQAEEQLEVSLPESLAFFKQGVRDLLMAYLVAKGLDTSTDLAGLFRRCLEVEPEFEAIKAEFNFLVEVDLSDLDADELADTANEIWDFIIGVLPGEVE